MTLHHPDASFSGDMATQRMGRQGALGQYLESSSGCRFVYARPQDDPELWRAYLRGAADSYRRFGVERVLEFDSICSGEGTTLFVAAIDEAGHVVAGVRAQGPYRQVDEPHALVEWAGRPGTAALRRGIAARIDEGLLELKAGWVSADSPLRHALTPALARTAFHIFRLIGARYALCTVADHAVRRWLSSGAQTGGDVAPVAYPDSRYRTVPIWWDRETMLEQSDAAHLLMLAREQEMFERSLAPVGATGTLAAA